MHEEILNQNFVLIQDVLTKSNHFEKLAKFYDDVFQEDPTLIIKSDDFATIKHEPLHKFLGGYGSSY